MPEYHALAGPDCGADQKTVLFDLDVIAVKKVVANADLLASVIFFKNNIQFPNNRSWNITSNYSIVNSIIFNIVK